MSKEAIRTQLKNMWDQGYFETPEQLQEFAITYARNIRAPQMTHISDTTERVIAKCMNGALPESLQIDLNIEFSPIEALMAHALSDIHIIYKPQYTIGKYRADFFVEPNIVIECDGDRWHGSDEKVKKDRIRDKFFFSRGYIVRRFTGREIRADSEKCAREIEQLILSVSKNGS